MGKKVITISREYGSGGHFIGEQVAKRLNIPYYDVEIIGKIAEETGFSEEYIEEKSEYSSGKSIFSYALLGRDTMGSSVADQIFVAQTRIIRDIAQKESCVIIGRCADYILRDFPDALHVFVHGEEDVKSERLQTLYNISPKEAQKRMKDMDKRRSINYRYCTDRTWGDMKNYTMTLNSSVLGHETCIDIICGLAK
ncbi:MAG: cytidylate kinase-like family protein [Clostridiales bacterium]|nr:cytidylate kinase-like family protein [Clostridiales bacterium]